MTAPANHRIVMDVDTGVDDALAILLALAHPNVDVLAITCVSGNVPVDDVVANTLTVLDVAQAADIPVARGAERPLLGPSLDATAFHGSDGLAGQRRPSTRTASLLSAVDLIAKTLELDGPPITIVALGPQTNIATLLLAKPECAKAIERIVFMGGALQNGNVTATGEFNIWNDPEAAAIVLRSGIPITMYPIEPFLRLQLEEEQLAELSAGGAASRLAVQLLGTRQRGYTIGDAGALCVLIDPAAAQVVRAPVSINLSALARGQTVVDRRVAAEESLPLNDASMVDVVLDIDVRRAGCLFVHALQGGRDAAPVKS